MQNLVEPRKTVTIVGIFFTLVCKAVPLQFAQCSAQLGEGDSCGWVKKHFVQVCVPEPSRYRPDATSIGSVPARYRLAHYGMFKRVQLV